jgi:murein DD-endopeptidase MepM/ murein hydrolase activator NlpD
VQVGEQVARGQLVGRCGNSGNSTEPHLHLQAMDRASVWVAAARPLLVNGRELPPNGSVLRSAHDHGTRSGGSAEAAGHAGRAGNEEG